MALDLSRHHLPGYGGFVSNTREDFGRTFGQTTRDALRIKVARGDGPFPAETVHAAPFGRRSASASGKLGSGPASPEYYRGAPAGVAATLDRAPSLEEQHMPGYAGYVSPLRMPAGSTYGHGSRVAVHVKEQALSDARNHQGSLHNPPPVDAATAVLAVPGRGLFEPNASDSKPEFEQPSEHKLPGYSAFIAGAQHHYGRTYGHLTRGVARSPEGRWPSHGIPPESGAEADHNHHGTRHWEQEQVPGYTGFVRHAKDDHGKTYGRLTRERLRDGRAEVQQTRAHVQAEREEMEQRAREDSAPIPFTDHRPLDPAVRLLGDAHHLPGYTGYIHRAEHKLAKTYGQITREVAAEDAQSPDAPVSPLHYLQRDADAGADAEAEREADQRWQPATPTARTLGYTGYRPGTKYAVAQTYGRSTRAAEDLLLAQRPARSPAPASSASPVHRQPDPSPPAHDAPAHLPGYTGHLPHAQDIIAKTFGDTARDSLRAGPAPTPAHRDPTQVLDQGAHRQKGHLPGYTGFVPGFNHDYGETYGKHTREHISEFAARTNGLK